VVVEEEDRESAVEFSARALCKGAMRIQLGASGNVATGSAPSLE
jgi:hypothetical protein